MLRPMPLHVRTPLVHHPQASERLGREVWLKLEALQPAGSFKMRGVGALCEQAVAQGARRLVSSSGGNAGLATARAGRMLGVEVLVVTPESTPLSVQERMQREGAQVLVHGAAWDEADAHARGLVDARAAYVHPFDDPRLWAGHASMVAELAEQGPRPDLLVLSVGGGGLLCGALEGLHAQGWANVPVLAAETRGAHSFAAAIEAGERVSLPAITSVAKTLGARRVAAEALAWTRRHDIRSRVVEDAEALRAIFRFADEQRLLVEPSCGAALAALEQEGALGEAERVVLIVCGGAGATLDAFAEWKALL